MSGTNASKETGRREKVGPSLEKVDPPIAKKPVTWVAPEIPFAEGDWRTSEAACKGMIADRKLEISKRRGAVRT